MQRVGPDGNDPARDAGGSADRRHAERGVGVDGASEGVGALGSEVAGGWPAARVQVRMKMAKQITDTVSVKLPGGVLAGLDRVAALTGRNRSEMLTRILRAFLSSDDSALSLRPWPADLRELSRKQRAIVKRRAVILDDWDRACAEARKARWSKPAATADFLERLEVYQGVKLSRASLYNWRRRWAAGGDAALVDRRGLKRLS